MGVDPHDLPEFGGCKRLSSRERIFALLKTFPPPLPIQAQKPQSPYPFNPLDPRAEHAMVCPCEKTAVSAMAGSTML